MLAVGLSCQRQTEKGQRNGWYEYKLRENRAANRFTDGK